MDNGKPFEVGDQVMLHSAVIPRGNSRKLYRPWTDPYKVIKKLSDITYRIQRCQGRKRLVVHFNRLKLCPINIQDNSKQSHFSDSHVAELTPSHQLPCEQLAYIPDDDDDDESNSEFMPVISPNVEETVVTSLPGSSDVVSTLEETEGGTYKSQCEARTSGLDLSTDGILSRRYPSRSH